MTYIKSLELHSPCLTRAFGKATTKITCLSLSTLSLSNRSVGNSSSSIVHLRADIIIRSTRSQINKYKGFFKYGRRREVANWDGYSKYSRSDKVRVLHMKGKCQIIGLGDSGVGSGCFKSS